MRVTLQRSGGFAGLKRTVTVDTEQLHQADARELERLVAAANVECLSTAMREAAPAAARGADRFNYRLLIRDAERHLTVELGEAEVSARLRPLIEWLLAHRR